MSRLGHLLPSADSPGRDVKDLGESLSRHPLALSLDLGAGRRQAPADWVARVEHRRRLPALEPRQCRVTVAVATTTRHRGLAAPAALEHAD